MPMGKGTYGSKRGRPPKKAAKKMGNGLTAKSSMNCTLLPWVKSTTPSVLRC